MVRKAVKTEFYKRNKLSFLQSDLQTADSNWSMIGAYK